jgi:RES domain-containing protein
LNITTCAVLLGRNVTGHWYRGVKPRYAARAIETSHTVGVASRFSLGAFEVLYLAEDQQVALYEVEGLYGSPTNPVPNPANALLAVPAEVYLTDVADLTDPTQADLIGTNAQELTGDWREFAKRPTPAHGARAPHTGEAPTQQLGAELYRLGGFKGLVSFSAKRPERKVIAVFTQRLAHSPCWIRYSYDDEYGRRQTIRIP